MDVHQSAHRRRRQNPLALEARPALQPEGSNPSLTVPSQPCVSAGNLQRCLQQIIVVNVVLSMSAGGRSATLEDGLGLKNQKSTARQYIVRGLDRASNKNPSTVPIFRVRYPVRQGGEIGRRAPDLGLRNHRFQNIPCRFNPLPFYEGKRVFARKSFRWRMVSRNTQVLAHPGAPKPVESAQRNAPSSPRRKGVRKPDLLSVRQSQE